MKKILLALACLLLSAHCLAQVVTSKGVGTVSYNWSRECQNFCV